MKSKKTKNSFKAAVQKAPIKTSFMEIIEGLTRLTKDDTIVLAAVKEIFSAYRVRLAKSAVTIRLVYGQNSQKQLRRGNLGRRSSAWA